MNVVPREETMSYWIRLCNRACGPFTANEVVRMPEVELNTLLCPKGRDIGERRNWRFARAFSDIREPLALLRSVDAGGGGS